MQPEVPHKKSNKSKSKKTPKNDFDSLPPMKLFQMAEQKLNTLDYEEAEYLYKKGYQKDPYNQMLILCYANLLKTLGKQQQSQKILQQSLERIPNGSCVHKRYFQLAELYQGEQAIALFQRGILEGMKILNNPFKCNKKDNQNQEKQFGQNSDLQTRKVLAEAYASIAEVCMSDLLDMPSAENICLTALQKGQNIYPQSLDIWLQLANYHLFKQNEEQSVKYLNNIYEKLVGKKKTDESLPYQLTLQCAKYFIQTQHFSQSLHLVTTLKQQNTQYQEQLTYLQAFCNFKLNQYDECEGLVDQFYQRKQEADIQVDGEIQDAMKQLKQELLKAKSNRVDDGDTGLMQAEDGDDDWQDQSEGDNM